MSTSAWADAVPEVSDALAFTSEDGRFSVSPIAQVQALFVATQGLGQGGVGGGGFVVRRARIGVDGHLFTKDLIYQVEGNWDEGQPALQDAYISYALNELAHVQVGQMKRPFSRDFITSSTTSLTFERAALHDRFFIGRDVGAMVHNDYARSPEGFEYVLGVFNGSGNDVRFDRALPDFSVTHLPVLLHPAFLARAGINLGGIDGYVEGDLEGGPVRLAVASSVILDAPNEYNAGLATAEIDLALKAYGLWATGALYLESPPLDTSAGAGTVGVHTKGSYTIGDGLLPTVGYGMYAPIGGSNARHEVMAGAAVLLYGWHARLMTDAVVGFDTAPGVVSSDVSVRFGVNLNL